MTRDEWYDITISSLDSAAQSIHDAADEYIEGFDDPSEAIMVGMNRMHRLAGELEVRANRLRIRYHREKKRVGIADPPQSKCHQVGCETYLDDDKFYYCVRCGDPFCEKHVTDYWVCETCRYKHRAKED